jgi:hypothetical protein
MVRDLVRRGPRTVMLTPPLGPRVGNFLYWWLHAHVRQAAGQPYRVVTPDHLEPWLVAHPALRDYGVREDQVGLTDRREWPAADLHMRFGIDFDLDALTGFVRSALLEPRGSAPPALGPDDLVVNVRRGDYYADPGFRARFGIDVHGYLAVALDRVADRGPIPRIHVVSDDIAWCRASLTPLLANRADELTWAAPGDPVTDLDTLSRARRLIGANSTFSYWGGYIASVRHEGRVHVVMPGFHAAGVHDGRAVQLDPAWDRVEEPDAGWFGSGAG